MVILSFAFFWFLTAAVLLYYIVPNPHRWKILLIASMFFYGHCGLLPVLAMMCGAAATYLSARSIETATQKIWPLSLGIAQCLGLLVVLKYSVYFQHLLARFFHISLFTETPPWIVPLGISYYTLSCIGYLIDVYREEYPAERNPFRLLLYVVYFPCIVVGPVLRYGPIADKLFSKKTFNPRMVAQGAELALWGLFKKLVVADSLGPVVDVAYQSYDKVGGILMLVATTFFAMQLYADFSGIIDVMRGVSRLFGIELPVNFKQPYFAKTVPEFWRRWHITLGSWFRDYVFYPLSVSAVCRNLCGIARNAFGDGGARFFLVLVPTLFVWILIGLWHGGATRYVAWGVYYGLLVAMSAVFAPANARIKKALPLPWDSPPFTLVCIVRTFALGCAGRVLFRAESVRIGLSIIHSILLSVPHSNIDDWRKAAGFVFEALGSDGNKAASLVAAYVLLFCVSLVNEEERLRRFADRIPWPLRWCGSYAIILFILLFGEFGSGGKAIYQEFQ